MTLVASYITYIRNIFLFSLSGVLSLFFSLLTMTLSPVKWNVLELQNILKSTFVKV